jgi:(2R)-3-sulfolactate dehydrogenase (NADP+)
MSGERLTLAEAHVLVARTLERCRTSPENAASVARALVAAEADGLKGHGLARVPSYAAQAKVGKVDGFATPRTSQPRPALVLVDAAAGFAYPALDAARPLLVEAARREGVAAVAVRRSHHCGAAGRIAESLAEAGLVALFFANTPAAIASWGGSRGLLAPTQSPLRVRFRSGRRWSSIFRCRRWRAATPSQRGRRARPFRKDGR